MRISSVLQTPFISHEDENMLYIRVADWDMCNPYLAEIFAGGELICEKRVFASEFSAMIPCYNKECVAIIRITPFEDTPFEYEFVITPQRHWKIPLLYSSHEDLGYCGYVEKLHYESYEYLKKAMELCQNHEQFKYMIEHYWWLDAFDTYATEKEKNQLRALFEQKKMDLSATHSGVHTSWENAEQLVRQMYFGTREASEKYGICPKCAFFVDLSGATWSVVNAYAKMGIKYIGILPNSFRNSKADPQIPPIFWWKDKSGERVLLWYQRAYRHYGLDSIWCDTLRQYPQGSFYFDTTKAVKTEKWISEKINSLPPCEYDIFPISFYDDRELPTTMLLTVCEEMNKKWKYPKFTMEIPTVFMSELEEKYGDTIPTLQGDISDQWADFATIAPNWLSKKREAARMLYDVEMLSTLDSIDKKTPYCKKEFRDIYFKLSEFDEHCWATSSKHPQAMHRHNLDKVKRQTADSAYDILRQKTDTWSPKNEKISVLSTIPHKRRSRIYASKNDLVPSSLNHQILPNGDVITEEIEFCGIEAENYQGITPYKVSNKINNEYFETDFYKIKLNYNTKKIVSIIDKETGREYLDKASRFELGQFIYVYTEGKTSPDLNYEVPKKTEFELYEGELAYVLAQKGYEEQSGATVKAQFVFFKQERAIDVELSYENALGLIGDFYDRYKKNYFFAFPFSLDNSEFYTELPLGEKNEKRDIIPLNANDFTVTQGWVAAESENSGVALYTRDMNVFHLGSIRYNQFKSDFSENKGHFYLYASSNRCNNLVYKSTDECFAKYRLSILLYNGSYKESVPVWSYEREHRLLICKENVLSCKTLKMSCDNIRLVCLKLAEDNENAVIVRLAETQGRNVKCNLALPFAPIKAVYTDNKEAELEEITEINGNTLTIEAKPYSYTTIKIYFQNE